ncbi:MAG TPA: hypothetical protein VGM57_00375 [Pseudolabrys sp.]|jgi:hypothetical protein
MPEGKKLSGAAVGMTALLSVFALIIYAAMVATLSSLAGGDAAGNGMAQGFAAIEIILLWLLLGTLALIALGKGDMPKPAAIAALILVPASAAVAFEVLALLSRPHQPPHLWPLIIPAAIPPLIILYCFWALLPPLRAAISARVASGAVWGLVFILCAAIVPFDKIRAAADDRDTAALEKYEADLAKVPQDAPLWDWAPFFTTRNATKLDEMLKHIATLDRRQADAELMLARGDFPLGYLGRLDLTPTPALCDNARALLRKRVAPLVLTTPQSKSYRDIAGDVSDALAAMTWLIGYDCDATAEAQAWETMANGYKDTNYDVYDLRNLRDPKKLGGIVRNYPERFSQLTPRAHLKAWLSFADKKEYREQAIAGARMLDHRNADAVEMLLDRSDISAPWTVLKYLPVLELEPTPPLCREALTQIHGDLDKVLRPKADDPRPYRELIDRLGVYEPLTALLWLASHGCDAQAELNETAEVIRTYQPSPASAAMLDRLTQLRKK